MEKYKVEDFGKLSDGQSVSLYTLENDLGDQVKVSTYGACLVAFIVCWQRKISPVSSCCSLCNC